MRIYATKTIEASIQPKKGKGPRGTADDFEIVPEHDEEHLIEVRCDICGVQGEIYDVSGETESSLLAIEIYRASRTVEREDITADILGEMWLEYCEACMRQTVIPTLKSLRRFSAPENPEEEHEDEPAILAETEGSVRRPGMSQGALIGEEESRGMAPPLPPLSADEPF